ncbi:unnamed protein product, partial [Oikopleura dioica]
YSCEFCSKIGAKTS